jgi:hypothetical protein
MDSVSSQQQSLRDEQAPVVLGFPLFKDEAEAALERGEELVEIEVPNTGRSWPPFGVLGMPP